MDAIVALNVFKGVAFCSFLAGVAFTVGVVKVVVALAVFLGVAFWGVAFFVGVVDALFLIGDVNAVVAFNLEFFIGIALCTFLGGVSFIVGVVKVVVAVFLGVAFWGVAFFLVFLGVCTVFLGVSIFFGDSAIVLSLSVKFSSPIPANAITSFNFNSFKKFGFDSFPFAIFYGFWYYM